MSERRLRVGFAGLSLGSYFAEKLGYRERSIEGLQQLASDWDFELHAISEALQSEADSQRAAATLRAVGSGFPPHPEQLHQRRRATAAAGGVRAASGYLVLAGPRIGWRSAIAFARRAAGAREHPETNAARA